MKIRSGGWIVRNKNTLMALERLNIIRPKNIVAKGALWLLYFDQHVVERGVKEYASG